MLKSRMVFLTNCISVLLVSEALAKEVTCEVPLAEWQSRTQVKAFFAIKGWEISRIKIDDGCYELKATDDKGQRVEVKINPKTLKILEIENN